MRYTWQFTFVAHASPSPGAEDAEDGTVLISEPDCSPVSQQQAVRHVVLSQLGSAAAGLGVEVVASATDAQQLLVSVVVWDVVVGLLSAPSFGVGLAEALCWSLESSQFGSEAVGAPSPPPTPPPPPLATNKFLWDALGRPEMTDGGTLPTLRRVLQAEKA